MDMTQLLKRALPFMLAFVFGVTCTAIVRSFLPTHRRTTFIDNGRPGCKWRARRANPGSFEPKKNGYTVVDITEVQDGGRTTRSTVHLQLPNSYEDRWTLKERMLLSDVPLAGSGLSTDFAMSYVSPEAIDGHPVTSDAVLSSIPRPRFWATEQARRPSLNCNAIVRVELDSSGKVSKAEKVPGYADACPYTEDIVQAASQISFRPALRDGVPVSQRMSIIYRSN